MHHDHTNGHTYDGHTYDGHTYDGHTYDGHTYDGHTYDGHTNQSQCIQIINVLFTFTFTFTFSILLFTFTFIFPILSFLLQKITNKRLKNQKVFVVIQKNYNSDK